MKSHVFFWSTLFIGTFVFIWRFGDVPRWWSALNGAIIVTLLFILVSREILQAVSQIIDIVVPVTRPAHRAVDRDEIHVGPRPDCPECAKPGFSSG